MQKQLITIGMDIGLRSNGIIALDENNNIIDLLLIPTFASDSNTGTKIRVVKNSEDIIIYNCYKILKFIKKVYKLSINVLIGIERLSYNSISSSKDLLAGIHWAIRKDIKEHLSKECFVISPKEWRKGIITTWDKVKYEIEYPDEDMNKLIPYLKIPITQKKIIDKYLKTFNETMAYNKNPRYDLSDAFWVARFIMQKKNKKSMYLWR